LGAALQNEVPTHGSPLKYRPDIDGLRALAVLSVLFYHLDFPLHGGFVGVDIFFTISGFLIGSIVLQQTANGTFTFAGFYERRIRRIFPALFVMLFATMVLAYAYMLPLEFVAFSKSLVAAAFSASNVYFWLQSGYFDAPASEIPLLHTWSLAIEEQFYIFLPITLVLLRRFSPGRINLVVCLLAVISFLVAVYGAYRFPSATFYLLHTRAWELLLGIMLALPGFPKLRGSVARNAAGVMGGALILPALLLYRSWIPFPGLAALPPCLGTALIIYAGESGPNIVGRFLSLKPFVFVGLISYSLYLWHWPLVVFYKFGFTVFAGLDHHESQALLLALSVALGVLSWRFVETPIRSRRWTIRRPALFGAAIAATGILLAVGIVGVATQGGPGRLTEQAREVASFIGVGDGDGRRQTREGDCFITSETAKFQDYSTSKCLSGVPGRYNILIIGDSHAAALWSGFEQVFVDANVMQATASGCKPVLHQRPRQHLVCSQIMSYIFNDYLPTHRVDALVIEAHWEEADLPSLGETIARLHQLEVPTVLVGPIVQYDSSLPRLLALSITQNDALLPHRHLEKYLKALDGEMASLAREEWHVPYISLLDILCAGDSCTEYAAPGVPLQYDAAHLTRAGSTLTAQRIAEMKIISADPRR
jgi:peptidoglycan/LPS O-acetylase OafA/YrhL